MRQQLRRPALRAPPANHTALVSFPRLDDVVIPPPPPPTRLIPTASKQKFLELYSTTVGNRKKKRKRSSGGNDSQQQLVAAAAASGTDDKLDDDEEERKQPSDDASWIMPTDTKIALEMMCAQFPKIEKASVRPFVLRTQLYSSVRDRTLVDRELEVLRQQQVVRTFKLSTGQDDYAIMFMADYLSQIEAAKKRLDLKESLLRELEVFDWFVAQVIPSCLDVGISHSHLLSLLSQGGSVKDSHVSLLMNAGLLVRQLVDETAYWFSIPNVGFLLKSISSGRKELLSFLSRRRYKEMLQAPLERHALRYSQLGLRFHLRDLLGLGQLHVVPSPSGPLIRVVHD
jgi:serine/threonine-protein kinase 19